MKNKLLNTFSIKSNGETIIVNVSENDKGIVIDINGTTMDVLVNGEEFYSKFDKEEYKYIPSHLRSFVSDNICSWGEGLVKEGAETRCDLLLEGREYLLNIPTQRAKKNDLTLRDWLISYIALADDEKIADVNKEKEVYEKLIANIESNGYKLRLSHGGDDYDNWFDLVVPINDFDYKRVIKCLKLWSEYNEYMIETYMKGRY